MKFTSTTKKLAGIILSLGLFSMVSAQQLVYITGNNKIGVITDPSTPSEITGPFNITGLPAGQTIEGIDYRPRTGELYAIGYNANTQEAQLYVINQTSAFATAIGTANVLALTAGQIGFDFNPTVDRIRLTSSNGANYRLHPSTGLVVATDGTLAYAASDTNNAEVSSISTVAYTRSYIGSESTTLYDIDLNLNILTSQVPPNNGTLNTIGVLNLALNHNSTIGMDIYYDGVNNVETAYLTANTGSLSDSLYTLDLVTGTVSNWGQIGNGMAIRDIAAVIKRTLPSVSGLEAYALTAAGNLIVFDSENPRIIRNWTPISGITAGQQVLGLDFRPATSELYAFGYDRPFSQYQLYTIDLATGSATAVNATPIGIELDTAIIGFDFNPVVDRIRVAGAHGENYRINPDNGTLAGVDTDFSFAAGDMYSGQMPFVTSVAYTNSYANALSTTLYAYVQSVNNLAIVESPNQGVLTSQFALDNGIANVALDSYFDIQAYENVLYAASNTTASVMDKLYVVSNGILVEVDQIGFGIPVKSLAMPIGETPNDLSVLENSSELTVNVYPNPASDYIVIQASSGLGQYAIIDMTGRTVLQANSQTENTLKIDVSHFSSGVYFILLENGTKVKWVKK